MSNLKFSPQFIEINPFLPGRDIRSKEWAVLIENNHYLWGTHVSQIGSIMEWTPVTSVIQVPMANQRFLWQPRRPDSDGLYKVQGMVRGHSCRLNLNIYEADTGSYRESGDPIHKDHFESEDAYILYETSSPDPVLIDIEVRSWPSGTGLLKWILLYEEIIDSDPNQRIP